EIVRTAGAHHLLVPAVELFRGQMFEFVAVEAGVPLHAIAGDVRDHRAPSRVEPDVAYGDEHVLRREPAAGIDDDVVRPPGLNIQYEPVDVPQLFACIAFDIHAVEIDGGFVEIAGVHISQSWPWMIHVCPPTKDEQDPHLKCRAALRYDRRMPFHTPAEAAAAPALRERAAIPDKFKWNLTHIFPDWEEWQRAYDELDSKIGRYAAL